MTRRAACGFTIGVLAAVVLGVPAGAATYPPPGPAQATPTETRIATEFCTDVNNERAARSLSGLACSYDGYAQTKVVTGADLFGVWTLGAPDSGGAVIAMMQSDAHRQILLAHAVTAISIGVWCAPGGVMYVGGDLSGLYDTAAPPPANPQVTPPGGTGCASNQPATSTTLTPGPVPPSTPTVSGPATPAPSTVSTPPARAPRSPAAPVVAPGGATQPVTDPSVATEPSLPPASSVDMTTVTALPGETGSIAATNDDPPGSLVAGDIRAEEVALAAPATSSTATSPSGLWALSVGAALTVTVSAFAVVRSRRRRQGGAEPS